MLNHVGGYQEVNLASKEVHSALSKTVEVLVHEATHAAFYYRGWDNAHKSQDREKDTFYQYGWKAGDAILNNPRQEVKEELKLMRKELIKTPSK